LIVILVLRNSHIQTPISGQTAVTPIRKEVPSLANHVQHSVALKCRIGHAAEICDFFGETTAFMAVKIFVLSDFNPDPNQAVALEKNIAECELRGKIGLVSILRWERAYRRRGEDLCREEASRCVWECITAAPKPKRCTAVERQELFGVR
jgi:hypothetical protein